MQNEQLSNNYQQRENNINNSARNNYRNNHSLENRTNNYNKNKFAQNNLSGTGTTITIIFQITEIIIPTSIDTIITIIIIF